MKLEVRPPLGNERCELLALVGRRWGGTTIVARGERIELEATEMLLALTEAGEWAGLCTYRVDYNSLEIVTIDAFTPGQGVGTALLGAARQVAVDAALWRLWLVTTNDNLDAIAFYLRRGLRIATVHQNAGSWARVDKPSIPELGNYGIRIEDELEFELVLGGTGPPPRNPAGPQLG